LASRFQTGRFNYQVSENQLMELTEENARDEPAGGEVTACHLLSIQGNPVQPAAGREWIQPELA